MAVTAFIGICEDNGDRIDYIYNHFASDPSRLLPILETNYNTPEAVRNLLRYGDSVRIEASIEDTEFILGKTDKVCFRSTLKDHYFRGLVNYLYLFSENKWEVIEPILTEMERRFVDRG